MNSVVVVIIITEIHCKSMMIYMYCWKTKLTFILALILTKLIF